MEQHGGAGMFRAQVHLEAAGETDGLGQRTASRPWQVGQGVSEGERHDQVLCDFASKLGRCI